MIYGYCRISRKTQNIDRQVRNISEAFPTAKISKEEYTGRKIQGRKELNKILKQVRPGDTIVFDSVSRMSRNAEEGFQLYQELYADGINLVFLKEPYCNTAKYQETLAKQIDITINTGDSATDALMQSIIDALNTFRQNLVRKDIELAFEQAQKEVDDLRQRTIEGIETARRNGKQIGLAKNTRLKSKKSVKAKNIIRKHNRTFGGNLTNEETWTLAGISKMTFYKYKDELIAEMQQE